MYVSSYISGICKIILLFLQIVFSMGSFRDEEQNLLSIYMPYLPLSLSSILASPYFSPHAFPPSTDVPEELASRLRQNQFITIAKGIMIQTLDALAFLHDEQRRIGHRDIKPENIMLTKEGCVKLIDFGVSWKENEPDLEKNDDLWPEYRGKLYFEVSTRAYRAPELLFGTRHYDQCAVDLWSIGATFAEFFTALRLESGDEDDGDDDDDTEPDVDPAGVPLAPFIVPKYLRIGYPGAQWKRDTLFNGERGEIGLAWSIFKIFGTPTEDNWPVCCAISILFFIFTDYIFRALKSFRERLLWYSTSLKAFLSLLCSRTFLHPQR